MNIPMVPFLETVCFHGRVYFTNFGTVISYVLPLFGLIGVVDVLVIKLEVVGVVIVVTVVVCVVVCVVVVGVVV